MKILIATGIYPPEIGGPAGYVKGVATELANQGHEIAVVTYGDEKTEQATIYKVIAVHRSSNILYRYFKYFWQTFKLARKSDLIYVQGPVSEGLPATLASIFARKPLVLKIVGDYAWEQYQQIHLSSLELLDEFVTHRHAGKVWLMEATERWVAKRAKAIIVPSKYLKSIVEKWGISPNKIKVVYNSIAPLPHLESEEHEVIKTSDKQQRIILTAIRAVPWKGGDFLCDVIKDLPEEYILAVAGDGPKLEDWKKHAQEIGVSNRVMWLGRLSRVELAKWYRKADLFVLATGYEGFPHVVVEAVSTGLPCIVSDKGGNPEIAELFPNLVKVAPYQDKQAWVNLINSSQVTSRAFHIEMPEILGFNKMVEETLTILSSHASNSSHHSESANHQSKLVSESALQNPQKTRLIMISLDRKLFEPGQVRDRIINQLQGFEATIIVFGKQKFDEQIAPNIQVISTNSWNKFFYVTDALWLIWKLRKQKFAVITSQDPIETGLVAYLGSRIHKSALAIQDHGYHFHGNYYRLESWLNQFRYLLARFIISRADAIRVVSQRTKDALINLSISQEKIIRFPLTFDVNSYCSVASSKHSSLESKEENSESYFLLVCRFVPIKRIDLAIHAFSIFFKQNPNAKLKIIGQGPLENQIKQWIADFELQDKVEIIPWTENLADYYRKAVATLITSDREGFGMIAVESLACGTPVIMTDVGCAHEVVKNEENGIIVPVGNVMAIANAMQLVWEKSKFQIQNFKLINQTSMSDFLQSAINNQQLAKQKLVEEMGKFEEKELDNKRLRLLFITQVVDKKDPILGFVVRWIQKFINQNVKMTVFTRKMVYTDLPNGAQGQDLGQPIIKRVLKLWYYSIKYRKDYDKVFVHMTPQIVVMGYPIWLILRKPVYMWYMHKSVTWWLKTALWISKKTFTASNLSLRVDSPKKNIVGHGIDTNQFKPMDIVRKPEVLWVSRIQPSKKLEESLSFMAEFKQRYPNTQWNMRIIGSSDGNEEYLANIKQEADRLGIAERVIFEGQKNHDELPQVFSGASVFISTSETGSIDKVVLESLACGTPVIAKGAEYHYLQGVVKLQDKETAMQSLNAFLTNPQTNEIARKGVIEGHDLERLIKILISFCV